MIIISIKICQKRPVSIIFAQNKFPKFNILLDEYSFITSFSEVIWSDFKNYLAPS